MKTHTKNPYPTLDFYEEDVNDLINYLRGEIAGSYF